MSYKTTNTTAIDVSNRKYNRLLAIKPTPKRIGTAVIWKCICDCGNLSYATVWQLKSGGKKSCGCWKIETSRDNINIKNNAKRLPKGIAARNQLFGRYKREANKRGLYFNLSVLEFEKLTSTKCFYCGEPPMQEYFGKNLNGTYIYNGIDRVNNNMGYKMDNVVPCCWSCNQMKADRSPEQFIEHVKKILINFVSKE